jgi:GNAT superfamily N-acetyltransferase
MTSYDKLAPDELRPALELLLAPPGGGRAAARALLPGFCDYLRAGNLPWEGWRSGPPGSPAALFLALLLPGHTALIFIPQPDENGIDPAAQLDLTRGALGELATRNLYYGQALLEAAAHSRGELLRQAGFRSLAPLAYMERSATYPWTETPSAAGLEWLQFDERTGPEFARTILASYQDSLDCPELTGIRPIDDIIASHQAVGRFDPALWELACVNGQPSGCLLLARHTHAPIVEVVYTGVVPAWRQRGVGGLLLRRALEQCRAAGARRLSVVVDDRNTPAKRLYERFAFTPVTHREAYWYRFAQ